MSRLVVVSNRIAIPDGSKTNAGGLAVGILDALQTTGGLWFGWNGRSVSFPVKKMRNLQIEQDGITYASFPSIKTITISTTASFLIR